MDEKKKLQIRSNIKKYIAEKINIYDLKNYTMEYFDLIINDLFDLSKDSIANIDNYQTYILRKCFGIFDNGELQNYSVISDLFGKTCQAIAATQRKTIVDLVSYSNEKYIINKFRLGEIKLEDIDVCDLDLSISCYHCLMKKGLYNVFVICNLEVWELEMIMVRKGEFNEIYHKIHSLGLYFVNDSEKDIDFINKIDLNNYKVKRKKKSLNFI